MKTAAQLINEVVSGNVTEVTGDVGPYLVYAGVSKMVDTPQEVDQVVQKLRSLGFGFDDGSATILSSNNHKRKILGLPREYQF